MEAAARFIAHRTRQAMDTYNARKAQEIAERLLTSADEIVVMLRKVEQRARALRRAALVSTAN
jgi:hypothetical protein